MDTTEKIRKIISPIQKEADIFEDKLRQLIDFQDIPLKESISNFLFKNTKRLRPVFTILFAKFLKIENEITYKIALAQEIIHAASLLHDDIIDNQSQRRGNITINSKYGNKFALLEGDFLLALSLEILSDTKIEIIKIFTDKIKKTIKGEIEQNCHTNRIMSEKEYFKKTLNKTANLFLTGLESLFLLKNNDNKTKKCLTKFLTNYSLAFQIKNDIEDIEEDFKNGNYTLPVLYFFKENNTDNINYENIKKYKDLAFKKLDDLSKKALEQLSGLEDNEYKNSIIELCKYTLKKRNLKNESY